MSQPICFGCGQPHPVPDSEPTATENATMRLALNRLYNAMCAAMANWIPPQADDKSVSDEAWARENQTKQALYVEMHAVHDVMTALKVAEFGTPLPPYQP